MSHDSGQQQPAPWYDGSSRPGAPPPDASTITVRGFDAPQLNPARTRATTSGARSSQQETHEDSGENHSQFYQTLRARRQSVAERLNEIGTVGGVNSLTNFAASWQRAAGFYQITPRPSNARLRGSDADGGIDEYSDDEHYDAEQGPSSLLRAALNSERRRASDNPVFDEDAESIAPSDVAARLKQHRRESTVVRRSPAPHPDIRDESMFAPDPENDGGGQTYSYGTLRSTLNEPARAEATRLYVQQQSSGMEPPDKEREPLLTQRVETPNGTIREVVVGQSTLPQTVFNSVNVLIGVGMLSLPLAIRYSGWLIGMLFFFASAVTTSYTAKLLAKCIDVDQSLVTFADIAYISFGQSARVIVSILFSLELLAACVALVILFADTIDLLIQGWGVTAWKVVCGVIVIPLSFMPMRFLSFTSIIGIMSCILIVLAVFTDGLIKPHALGSLREPAKTYLFPADWRTLPLGFGLLMAPWGGHSVFPNIYRDMRHSYKYTRAVNITYVFTYLLEVALAIAGYLMFGETVRDEITANIFLTEGYLRAVSIIIVIAIAIIPLTKIPLNARPIISTLEIFLGLDHRALPTSSTLSGMSNFTRGTLKIGVRIFVPILLVIVAILVPSFDRVMALLGSLACFSICIILPCLFHLKIFSKEMTFAQKALDWSLVGICTVLAVMGTVCAFLPKALMGAE